MKTIKLNLKSLEAIRTKEDLSMMAFSVRIGLEPSHYSKLLKSGGDRITVRTINRIAEALGIGIQSIVSF